MSQYPAVAGQGFIMFAPALIGKRYILHEELGKGGMGIVYRATDRLTGQVIALKQVMTPSKDPFATRIGDDESTAGSEFRLALAQEFQMLSSLRHPNIISVLDYGFDAQRQPYFTMDYLESAQTLLEAAKDQSVGFKTDLLAQTLQALAYLHRRGILHRDLKPANVLVKNGIVKVLDFGLATARIEHDPHRNQAAGTLAYMSPEVLGGGTASIASDMYAVGLMAYEMFSGYYPYDERDIQQLLHDILHKQPDVENLDIESALQFVIERLVVKSPVERFESAAEALIEINKIVIHGRQTLMIDNNAIRDAFLQAAQFVGREDEFDDLASALSSMTSGKGSAWLVGGESGVGKTRLLDELRTLGLVKGAFVLRGQNVSDGGRPYEMWRDVLRRLALQTELMDGEASVLKALVPDIAQLADREVVDPPELDTKAAQERLISIIGSVFRNQLDPILLILEDMHWASSESITVLQQLNVLVKDLPLMIVASYRDDESPMLSQELTNMRMLKLERLKGENIARLTQSMIGEAGRRERVVQFIERETEGNVFFMVEVIRALAEEVGNLDQIGLRTLPQTVVAGGIQLVVQRRLNRVPDEAWALLEAAAIAGRELDLDVLQSLVDSKEVAFGYKSLDKWLNACSEIAVLTVQHERWRFAHDKLRDGLLAAVTKPENLHRKIAVAIERTYADDMSRAAVLAYHWGAADDKEKIAHYATRAGIHAIQTGAGAQAKAFFEQAIDAVGRMPDTPENQRWLVDATLNLSRVGVYFASNDFPMILGRAIQKAENLNDEERMARIYGAAGIFYYTRGQVGEGLSFFAKSMTLAEKLGIEELLLLPYNNIGRAIMVTGDLPRAEAMLSRGIELADKFNDLELLAGSLSWYGYAMALQGRLTEAMPHVDRALELAQQVKDKGREIGITVVRGTIFYHCGRLDEALKDLRRAKEMAEELNSDIQFINVLGTLGCVSVMRGEIEEAIPYLDRCMLLAQRLNAAIGLPDFMVRRAEVELITGKPQEALALAQTALALAESTRQIGIKSVVMRVLSKIYIGLPEPDIQRAEELLVGSISNSEPGNVQVFMSISRLELARVYKLQGRNAEALAVLKLALDTFEHVGMTYYLEQGRELFRKL
jgi:tetratricopeptide (TPR) repeat protein